MIERYVNLIEAHAPQTILELGIFRGGSTAFLTHLARPQKLVALDLRPNRVEALDHFLAAHDARGAVRAHYGVDQSDVERVRQIVEHEFGQGCPLDLVIDDASHDLEPTRASFNALFPRLKPGGLYVIEDWSWGHFRFSGERSGPSMAKLIMELLLSLPFCEAMIEDLTVDRFVAVARRGEMKLDADPFNISDCSSARGRRLLKATDEGS